MQIHKQILAFLLLFLASVFTAAASDKCHVYLMDIEKAEKFEEAQLEAIDKGDIEEAKKINRQYVTMFDEFETTFEEEETTTKAYKIPNSNLFVTASVFYTDEMLPEGSITLAIAIGNKKFESALTAPPVAQTDAIYTRTTGTVRVKTFIKINKRSFVVGLQCDCNQS